MTVAKQVRNYEVFWAEIHLEEWHMRCLSKITTDKTGAGWRKAMKQISKLRLVESKSKLRKKTLASNLGTGINEPGELVTDLKNAMTLFYLALENLRSSLDQPAVCAKRIEELKSLTGRIHAQMEKLLELVP
jgi:hypothetical protein